MDLSKALEWDVDRLGLAPGAEVSLAFAPPPDLECVAKLFRAIGADRAVDEIAPRLQSAWGADNPWPVRVDSPSVRLEFYGGFYGYGHLRLGPPEGMVQQLEQWGRLWGGDVVLSLAANAYEAPTLRWRTDLEAVEYLGLQAARTCCSDWTHGVQSTLNPFVLEDDSDPRGWDWYDGTLLGLFRCSVCHRNWVIEVLERISGPLQEELVWAAPTPGNESLEFEEAEALRLPASLAFTATRGFYEEDSRVTWSRTGRCPAERLPELFAEARRVRGQPFSYLGGGGHFLS